MVCQLGLEHAVEVLTPADGAQGVAISELGEHSDLVGVLELSAGGHGSSFALSKGCAVAALLTAVVGTFGRLKVKPQT